GHRRCLSVDAALASGDHGGDSARGYSGGARLAELRAVDTGGQGDPRRYRRVPRRQIHFGCRPTLFLGARGAFNFDMHVELREGGHHSGNWGGLLANPGIILAQALACITDARGAIKVPEWRPPLPQSVRRALQGVETDGGEDGPTIDRDWGEPELTPAERVF